MCSKGDIIGRILLERERQDAKWGEQNHNDLFWHAILVEEVGELAKAIVEHHPKATLEKELVHIAAVAIAWQESLSRQMPAIAGKKVIPAKEIKEVELPSTAKAAWLVANVGQEWLPEMATDLLIAAIRACQTGDLEALAQEVASWQSTIELENAPEFLKQAADTETGRPWKEIKEELGLKDDYWRERPKEGQDMDDRIKQTMADWGKRRRQC